MPSASPPRPSGAWAIVVLWLALLALAAAVALGLPYLLPAPSGAFEHVLDDLRMRALVRPEPEQRVVIVDIDENSLAAIGPWPWPRATVAQLLRALAEDYQARAIAVDIVFPEARADDAPLAAQLRRSNVVAGAVFELQPTPGAGKPPGASLGDPPLVIGGAAAAAGALAQAEPMVANDPGLKPAFQAHISPYIDRDGAVRRLPALLCQATRCWPALSLATYARLLDSPRLELQAGHGWLAPHWWLHVKSGPAAQPVLDIPLDERGALLVPWRHARSDWLSVSAAEILHKRAPPDLLKNTVVLVGSTALGLVDVISTPLASTAAGLEPHAETLLGLLDRKLLRQPRHADAIEAAMMAVAALLLVGALLIWRRPLVRATLLPGWLLASWLAFGWAAVSWQQSALISLPLLPLLLFPPLALLLLVSEEVYRESRRREGVLALLGAYLPRTVARRLADSRRSRAGNGGTPEREAIAERRIVTVLFVDVQGFGGLCENQSPETIALLLQQLFTELSDAVALHGGTVDKYIGDAVMALWNAPDDDPLHAVHALACARQILAGTEKLQAISTRLGLGTLRLGIGVESGAALVGHFGTEHRRTYTALGDPVVLASRLEARTSGLNVNLLAGPGFAAALREQSPGSVTDLRALGEHFLRGRAHPTPIYTIDPLPATQGQAAVPSGLPA